ncbi:MAG: glycosyltransferase family 2 protein [Pyrinomonadaceae bacterium]|nr:glycosyltransferase family 2 protein [Pyrinomonadaceae bacterium]
MKLSIVIICWNDCKVIEDCLHSIFAETSQLPFEVIVSDNGSTDGSVAMIREKFPSVRIIENGANLGFARGNNAGIAVASGEYTLILNPDTVIRRRALEKLIAYADRHAEAGAFGARVLNPNGSFQNCARPLPSVRGYLIAALYLRWLARLSESLLSDTYVGWDGRTEREIGFQSGCCVMFRKRVLDELRGFDEIFFYHKEEVDLCCRVWKAGLSIRFYPDAEITHLGGQSVRRAPLRFALETYRSRYRYFYKHFGERGVRRIRWVSLLHLGVRWFGYQMRAVVKPRRGLSNRLQRYRVLLAWNWRLDPVKFAKSGEEPHSGFEPLAPPPIASQPATS